MRATNQNVTDPGFNQPLKVVAIGGGTGLSTLLRGLKHYVQYPAYLVAPPPNRPSDQPTISDLTAIVTVTDDGGSSGQLRKEFNILPPGDIRNCIVALSEDEALLSKLFRFRFPGESALAGHSFGNLFLTALTSITGDFSEAVRLSCGVLLSRGQIYPSTNSNVELEAIMDDGSHVRGETTITASDRRIKRLTMVPDDAKPLPQTLDAIRQADLITIGPGSLFTSLIPNVLVKGIPEAIAESEAVKVYVCNLMTQANESIDLSAADHIRAIYDHAGVPIFDFAIINIAPLSKDLKTKYALEGSTQIAVQPESVEALGVAPIFGHFLQEEDGVARHATDRVTRELIRIASGTPLTATAQ